LRALLAVDFGRACRLAGIAGTLEGQRIHLARSWRWIGFARFPRWAAFVQSVRAWAFLPKSYKAIWSAAPRTLSSLDRQ
jgi:hypothetical protein